MKEQGTFVVNAFNTVVRKAQIEASKTPGELVRYGYYWSDKDSPSGYIFRDGKWRKVDCIHCAIMKGWATLGRVMLFNSPEHVVSMVHEAERGPACRAHMPRYHLRLVKTEVLSRSTWTVGYQERFEKDAPIYEIKNMRTVSTEEEAETLLDNAKQVYNLDYFNRKVVLGKAKYG